MKIKSSSIFCFQKESATKVNIFCFWLSKRLNLNQSFENFISGVNWADNSHPSSIFWPRQILCPKAFQESDSRDTIKYGPILILMSLI